MASRGRRRWRRRRACHPSGGAGGEGRGNATPRNGRESYGGATLGVAYSRDGSGMESIGRGWKKKK
jgi:hypothetical protein